MCSMVVLVLFGWFVLLFVKMFLGIVYLVVLVGSSSLLCIYLVVVDLLR